MPPQSSASSRDGRRGWPASAPGTGGRISERYSGERLDWLRRIELSFVSAAAGPASASTRPSQIVERLIVPLVPCYGGLPSAAPALPGLRGTMAKFVPIVSFHLPSSSVNRRAEMLRPARGAKG